jgi:hypothetical protein
MSINDRIYIIDNLLNERRSISFQELLTRLEVSPATLKRDIAHMRDWLNAPWCLIKNWAVTALVSKGQALYLPALGTTRCDYLQVNGRWQNVFQ